MKGDIRYPLDDLLAAAGWPTMQEAARQSGIDRRQLYRWAEYGVEFAQCDDVATAFGLHPAEVWPEWLAESQRRVGVDVETTCVGCGTAFSYVRITRYRKWCSRRCCDAYCKANRTPEQRDRDLARTRAWHQAHREEMLAYDRRRYQLLKRAKK